MAKVALETSRHSALSTARRTGNHLPTVVACSSENSEGFLLPGTLADHFLGNNRFFPSSGYAFKKHPLPEAQCQPDTLSKCFSSFQVDSSKLSG